MKTLKYLLFIIVLGVIGLSIVVAMRPSTYEVSRSHDIEAPSVLVHSYIDDYKKWTEWSPWMEREPSAQLTYGDKVSGIDASYAWKGEVLGEGNMKTLYVDKDSILQQINFIKPFESSSDVYWNINAEGNTTQVVWGMKGELGFLEKAFMLFRGGMDKAIGPDYERGLQKLDSIVTTDMKKYDITDNGVTDYGGGYYLYLSTSSKQDETGEKMAVMFPKIASFMQRNGLEMAGKPFSLYEKWDESNGTTLFSACIPVKEKIDPPAGSEVLCGYVAPNRYYKTTLKGDYSHLYEAWTKATENLKAAGYEEVEGVAPFELYANDPMEHPNPAEWTTEIYIPIQ